RHWHHQVRLNVPLYVMLAEEACLGAGVTLAYYQSPMAIEKTDRGYHVTAHGKGLVHHIYCRQIVDCTGGADVVARLGLARQREEEAQPGTMRYHIEGYDKAALDGPLIQQRYEQALASGALEPGDMASKGGAF